MFKTNCELHRTERTFALSTVYLAPCEFREVKVKREIFLIPCYVETVKVSTDFVGTPEFIFHELKTYWQIR
jgi:hypothetical protein